MFDMSMMYTGLMASLKAVVLLITTGVFGLALLRLVLQAGLSAVGLTIGAGILADMILLLLVLMAVPALLGHLGDVFTGTVGAVSGVAADPLGWVFRSLGY